VKSIIREIRDQFPPRKRDSHKGNYGRVFILAGSLGMSGAGLLASEAALRAGAGLVTLGIPESLALPLSRRIRELMLRPFPETSDGTLARKSLPLIRAALAKQDVLAVGPGLSQNKETQACIREVVRASRQPMVIDADGLNAFSSRTALLRKLRAPAVLTPHPGEFRRLFGVSVPGDEKKKRSLALKLASRYRVVLVLKGHRTLVASPDGKGYVNRTGNPGMATAGSGDVLTGIIAGLMGQGLGGFDAARAGVYLHGLAGDFAVKKIGETSLVASDLIDFLPQAFRKALGR
jgi:NAD(P)H-hydrate epimerase